MLSAAKHLQYLLESMQMQILRFAQNDMLWTFFISLVEFGFMGPQGAPWSLPHGCYESGAWRKNRSEGFGHIPPPDFRFSRQV